MIIEFDGKFDFVIIMDNPEYVIKRDISAL